MSVGSLLLSASSSSYQLLKPSQTSNSETSKPEHNSGIITGFSSHRHAEQTAQAQVVLNLMPKIKLFTLCKNQFHPLSARWEKRSPCIDSQNGLHGGLTAFFSAELSGTCLPDRLLLHVSCRGMKVPEPGADRGRAALFYGHTDVLQSSKDVVRS